MQNYLVTLAESTRQTNHDAKIRLSFEKFKESKWKVSGNAKIELRCRLMNERRRSFNYFFVKIDVGYVIAALFLQAMSIPIEIKGNTIYTFFEK